MGARDVMRLDQDRRTGNVTPRNRTRNIYGRPAGDGEEENYQRYLGVHRARLAELEAIRSACSDAAKRAVFEEHIVELRRKLRREERVILMPWTAREDSHLGQAPGGERASALRYPTSLRLRSSDPSPCRSSDPSGVICSRRFRLGGRRPSTRTETP